MEFGNLPKYNSIYVGRVESNHDPAHLGRCKIRVLDAHADAKIEELPFAVPLNQTNNFVIPDITDLVYVMFINGDPNYPGYLGKIDSILEETTKKGFIDRDEMNQTPTDFPIYPYDKNFHNMGAEWELPKGPTSPTESQLQLRMNPSITVLNKTVKGNTIVLDDTDNKEEIKIIDRLGQQIKMIANVATSLNTLSNDNNNNRRVRDESPLNTKLKGIANNHTSDIGIKLIDVNGQEINMGNISDLSYIELKSVSSFDKEIYSSISINKNSITIKGVNNGVVHTKLNITPDGINIDAANIKLTSNDLVEIDSDMIVNGQLIVKENLIAKNIIKVKEEDE